MDRRAFTTALAGAGLALALPSTSHAITPRRPAAASDAVQAARIISGYRAAHGQPAVAIDPRLNAIAAQQAANVAAAGWLSHGDFAGRMATYPSRAAAENLAYGSPDVAGAIAQWQNSSAHNFNLLLAGARKIGLGRADSGSTRYWALVIAQ